MYGHQPLRKAKRYIRGKGERVDIDQSNSIAEYNKAMVGVDQMDQNISYYMISMSKKKWQWPLFHFAVNNDYELYRIQPLQPGQRILDLLSFRKDVVNVYCARNLFCKELPKSFLSQESKIKSIVRLDMIKPINELQKANKHVVEIA